MVICVEGEFQKAEFLFGKLANPGINPNLSADLLQCRPMTLNRDIAGNALQHFFFFRGKHISSLNVLVQNTANPGEDQARRRGTASPGTGPNSPRHREMAAMRLAMLSKS